MSHAEKTSISFDDLHELEHEPAESSGMVAEIDPAARISLGAKRSIAKLAKFPCDNCDGTGDWRPRPWSSRRWKCRKCKGVGKLKTDPAALRRAREQRQAKKDRELVVYLEAHKVEIEWCTQASARGFDFAKSMLHALNEYGSFTEGQLAAIRKCIVRDAERAKERAERKPDAEVAGAGFTRMLAAFASAKASGLKYPKFHVGRYVFSLASDKSRNAGCLYVKRESTYVGRITADGAYFAVIDANQGDRTVIAEIGRDPLAAAVMHGKETGTCSCCGRALENTESVERGIGPICAKKWGLA